MAEGKPVEAPVAVVYFRKDSGAMAKALGVRIRDQGAMTRLVWAHNFRGEEDIVEQAQAVTIQATVANAGFIARCYEMFTHNVEVHYVDDDGKFTDEPDHIRNQRRTNATIPGQAFADPRAALANLAASQSIDGVDTAPVEAPGNDGPTDPVSSEESEPEADSVRASGSDEGDEVVESDSGLDLEEIPEEDDRD